MLDIQDEFKDDKTGDDKLEVKENTEKSNSSILEIANYYLANNHLPSLRKELLQQGFLLVVSISGGSLYAVPANDYAFHHGSRLAGDSLEERQFNYIISTCIPALAVLYNATDLFFTYRHNEIIPDLLENFLIAPAGKVLKKIKTSGFLIGAAISAIPLMMVSFAYPLPTNYELIKVIQAIVVEIDNTILHLLPLELAWRHKVFRLPILPFEYLGKAIYSRYTGKQAIPINKNAEEIREQLINYIRYCKKKLMLENEWGFYTFHWTLNRELKSHFTNPSQIDLLNALVNQYSVPQAKIQSTSCLSIALEYLNSGAGKLAGLLGVGWVISSWGGYFVSPVRQIYEWNKGDSLTTGFIIAPALYLLGVLLSNFGFNWLKKYYEFITKWGQEEPKLPFGFKLYPKTYFFLQMISIYIMFYSYAAAEELVLDNFTEGILATMQPTFVWLARTGISFLGLNAIHELSETFLKRFAIYFGGEDSRLIARLITTLEQFEFALQIAKQDVFVEKENINYLKSLGFFANKDSLTESSPLLTTKPKESWGSWVTKKCCFWCSKQEVINFNDYGLPSRIEETQVRDTKINEITFI